MKDVMSGSALILKRDQAQPFRVEFPCFALIQLIPSWCRTIPAPIDIEQVCWRNKKSRECVTGNWLTSGAGLLDKRLQVLVNRCLDSLRIKCFDIGECSCFASCDARKEVSSCFVDLVILHNAVLACK